MKQLTCTKCGPVEEAFFDGYRVGDTLLEDVMFRITQKGNKLIATPKTDDDDKYLDNLNKKKWIREVATSAMEEDQDMECPKCGRQPDEGFVLWENPS